MTTVSGDKSFRKAAAMCRYHAWLAEATGFKALYVSGGGVAAGSCGVPDLGITTMEDVLIDERRITDITELPVLVDVDTVWGDALNIARTVCAMFKAGADSIRQKEVIKRLFARNVIANTTPYADIYVRVARSIVYMLDNIDANFRETSTLAKA